MEQPIKVKGTVSREGNHATINTYVFANGRIIGDVSSIINYDKIHYDNQFISQAVEVMKEHLSRIQYSLQLGGQDATS